MIFEENGKNYTNDDHFVVLWDLADKIRIVGKALAYDLKFDWMKNPREIEDNINDLINKTRKRLKNTKNNIAVISCACLTVIGTTDENCGITYEFSFSL